MLHSKHQTLSPSTPTPITIDLLQIRYHSSTVHQSYTQCKHCLSILIPQDKTSTNIIEDKKGKGVIWSCRFCKKDNMDNCLYYASSPLKYTLESNIKAKITSSIMLFLIDNSGSMHQSIFSNIKYGSNPKTIGQNKKQFNQKIIKIITQCTLYKQQTQLRAKIQNQYKQLSKNIKYQQQQISKIVLLYAIIEYNLKQLSMRKDQYSMTRVGFIFFSDMLYILKNAKQKQIPVYLQRGELGHQEWPYVKESVEFQDWEELYQKGRGYQKYFGDSRVGNFDVGKVAVNKVKGGGRTALGPALALAMGIISQHDQGSKVILATDSQPNFGLLSSQDTELIYPRIGQCLKQHNSTLTILQWSSDQILKQKQQKHLSSFLKNYSDHIEQIDFNLAKCKQVTQPSQLSFLIPKNINKTEKGKCLVSFFCDNQKVKLEGVDKQEYNVKQQLYDCKHYNFQFNAIFTQKPQQKDYLFPVIIQAVVQYIDLIKKQKCLCMSYIAMNIQKQNKKVKKRQQIEASLQDKGLTFELIEDVVDEEKELMEVYQRRRKEEIQESRTNYVYKGIQLEQSMCYMENKAEQNQEQAL